MFTEISRVYKPRTSIATIIEPQSVREVPRTLLETSQIVFTKNSHARSSEERRGANPEIPADKPLLLSKSKRDLGQVLADHSWVCDREWLRETFGKIVCVWRKAL